MWYVLLKPALLILLVTQLGASFAWAGQANSGSLEMGLDSSREESNLIHSQTVGVKAEMGVRHGFTEALTAHAKAAAHLETGAHSSNFHEQYAPQSRLQLYEARLNYQANPFIRLGMGAFEQTHKHLLLGRASFPGLSQEASMNSGHWAFGLHTAQLSPAGSARSTRLSTGRVLPFALKEELWVKYQLRWIEVQAKLGHMGFHQLHSAQAHESRFLGNRVQGLGPESATYATDFSTLFTGIEVDWNPGSRYRPFLDLSFLSNLSGSAQTGIRVKGGTGIQLLGHTLRPYLQGYRLTADVLPALYVDSGLGFTNRLGVGVGLDVHLKQGFRIGASYTQARPIQSSRFQNNLDMMVLSLEKDYEIY